MSSLCTKKRVVYLSASLLSVLRPLYNVPILFFTLFYSRPLFTRRVRKIATAMEIRSKRTVSYKAMSSKPGTFSTCSGKVEIDLATFTENREAWRYETKITR